LGFALDLYDEAEMHMIYWYADYLYGLRIYNLNEIHHAKEQPIGGSKKSPKRLPQKTSGQRPRNPPPLLLLLEATQSTVRGLFRLLAFCLRRDFISSPPAVTEGLAQRFVLRFRSLENFRLPHLPSFNDFQQSALSAQTPTDSRVVLEAAQQSFQEAKQHLDKFGSTFSKDGGVQDGITADSAKGVQRVVVANQLAITQLTQGLNTNKQMKVTADATHHPHLLSIKVQTLASN